MRSGAIFILQEFDFPNDLVHSLLAEPFYGLLNDSLSTDLIFRNKTGQEASGITIPHTVEILRC